MTSQTVVLKVTDCTHIAWFIYLMHIVNNSVVLVVVVVVAVVKNRNVCYNYYLPQVMLRCFFWNMDHEKESGRKCWMYIRRKPFSVGKLVHNRYVSWECKECMHVHSSSMIWTCNVGGGGCWIYFY